MKRTDLTDKQITAVKPTTISSKTGKPVTQLTDRRGLYLKLQWAADGKAAGNGHQWRFDYTRPTTGKRNTMSLGAYPTVSLAMAREGAEKARKLVAQGVDPCEVKEAAKVEQKAAEQAVAVCAERAKNGLARTGSLLGVCEDYHQGKVDTKDWTAQHAEQWLGMIKRCLPVHVAQMAIVDVKPVTILNDVVRPLEREGKIATSRTVRKYLAQVFDYAEVMELRQGNPARVVRGQCKQHVSDDLGNNPAVTTPAALTTVLAAIRAWPTVVTRAALQVQAALFQRPSDTCAMRWAALDLDAGLWKIKADPRTKIAKSLKGADHIVPLPKQVIELLRSLKPLTGNSEWVFLSPQNTRGAITNDTLTNALRSMGFGDKQTAHGFRATARSMLVEYLHVQPQHAEAQLAHSGGLQTTEGLMKIDSLGTAYARATFLEQRKVMVQQWADYLDQLLTGPQAVQPVPLVEQPVPQLTLAA